MYTQYTTLCTYIVLTVYQKTIKIKLSFVLVRTAENEEWDVLDVIEEVEEYYDSLLDMITLYLWKKTWIASQGHKTGCEACT